MKRISFSQDRVKTALKQEDLGMPLADIIEQAGISKRTFQRWKKQYGGVQKYSQWQIDLNNENARLKQIVTKLMLDNALLQDMLKGKYVMH